MKSAHACAAAVCLAVTGLAPGALAMTLEEAVAGDWRPEAETARDIWRNPVQTLEFFGVDPTGVVAEISPAGGYYARILGPWIISNGGTYVAVLGSADADDPRVRGQMQGLESMIAESGVTPSISYGALSGDSEQIAPPDSLDAVLTFRSLHGWLQRGMAEKAMADFYAALKPGGLLGLVAHRMPEDSVADNSGQTGYARESHVIEMAEALGFRLEDSSEINANPADTADHPMGVWTLPPTRMSPQAGTPEAEGFTQATYDAIGESDRMTLLFRKPE